eukprot:7059911-Prymnesium_polylepis.2
MDLLSAALANGDVSRVPHRKCAKIQYGPTLSRFQSVATCGAFISATSSGESAQCHEWRAIMVSCARSHAAKLGMRAQMGGVVSHAGVWPKLGKCTRTKLGRWSCVVCITSRLIHSSHYGLRACAMQERGRCRRDDFVLIRSSIFARPRPKLPETNSVGGIDTDRVALGSRKRAALHCFAGSWTLWTAA